MGRFFRFALPLAHETEIIIAAGAVRNQLILLEVQVPSKDDITLTTILLQAGARESQLSFFVPFEFDTRERKFVTIGGRFSIF